LNHFHIADRVKFFGTFVLHGVSCINTILR
jgi:hypothetical protein